MPQKSQKPPYKITTKIINLLSNISILVGKYEGLMAPKPSPQLRKQNKIKTIHGTLAIEGNTLDIDQITDLLDNKKIIGPKKDILEVKNAVKAYDCINSYNYQSTKSLLKAHKLLMTGLVDQPGIFRKKNVGILKGEKVAHVAPQPKMLPKLIDNLFSYLKYDKEENLIIKSCVFHYELEFIHPFVDGNGRIGRLWQSTILYKFNNLFEYIPIESLIKENQQAYYNALGTADKEGESTVFIEFMLEIILKALEEFLNSLILKPLSTTDRIEIAQKKFGSKDFSRKDYMGIFPTISPATASRDLKYCTEHKILEKTGDKRVTKYKFQ